MSSTCLLRLSSGPPGGRPYARLKAFTAREAPTPRTNDENTCPHSSESAQHDGRSNAESTNLQNYGEEGSLSRPGSSASTP